MEHEWIDPEEYPWTPKKVALPNGTMSYIDEGEGPPVLMLHGNPTWSFLYRKIIKGLLPDHRCIAPDHLGFGLSDKPFDYAYEAAAHAENLWRFMDNFDCDDITLVVQDWGGPIGLAWAAENVDRVSRIVIMNTWAWPVFDDPHYVKFSNFMGGAIGRFLIKRMNFFVNTVMKKAMGDPALLTPQIHSHYRIPLSTPQSRKACWVFPKEIIAATPFLKMVARKLPRLDETPALIVWGKKDIAFGKKELERWQKLFLKQTTVELDEVGHYVQEEAGVKAGSLIRDFIASYQEDDTPPPDDRKL